MGGQDWAATQIQTSEGAMRKLLEFYDANGDLFTVQWHDPHLIIATDELGDYPPNLTAANSKMLAPIIAYHAKHGTLDGYGEQPADTIWVPSVWCSATGSLYELAAYDTLNDKTNTADIALLVRSTPMTVSWLQWKAENKAVCVWPLAGSEPVATSEQPADPPDLGKPGVRPTREGRYARNFSGTQLSSCNVQRDEGGELTVQGGGPLPISDSCFNGDAWSYLGPLPDAQPESKPEPIEATRVESKPGGAVEREKVTMPTLEIKQAVGAEWNMEHPHHGMYWVQHPLENYLHPDGAMRVGAYWYATREEAQAAIDMYHARQSPEPVAWPLNGEWGAVGQRPDREGRWENHVDDEPPLLLDVLLRNNGVLVPYRGTRELVGFSNSAWDDDRCRYLGPLPEPPREAEAPNDLAARVEALEVKLAELMEGKE